MNIFKKLLKTTSNYKMSFINKNISYSQTSMVKNKLLKPLLAKFNNFLENKKDVFLFEEYQCIIPNNNKKFYCFIIKKNQLEDTKENYNILYFFSEYNNNEFVDFFIETEFLFNENILLEGYLYDYPNNTSFLATDILIKNEEIINTDYLFRYTLLNELFYPINLNLKMINNNITIGVHSLFNNENKNMIDIFKNNFIYKNEICCVEIINNFNKKRYIDDSNIKLQNENKIIEKTNYTDVYNVFNLQTKESEGILYVKGIKESVELKVLFKNNDNQIVTTMCEFNNKFNKWQPILV